jgi:sec-independent protein translocase protein TatC
MAKYDEDLFKDTTMTFGEHLDELRVALFKAVLGLAIGVIIGLCVGDRVVQFITRPLSNALGEYYTVHAEKEYGKFSTELEKQGMRVPYTREAVAKFLREGMLFEVRYVDPQQAAPAFTQPAAKSGEQAAAPSTDPSVQSAATTTAQAEDKTKPESEANGAHEPETIKVAKLAPLLIWHPLSADRRINPIALGVSEAFTIWLKASVVVGIVLSSPWVFYHIWNFVAAGLYPHEKRYVHVFLPFSLGLFLAGAATAYLFVFGPVLEFLLGFNQDLGLDPDPRISEWLGFVIMLPLGFGVSFQLPLVMLFLERIGIFNVAAYLEKWRIAILVIFVLSAVLTPADPYSLLLMAIPLSLLYFGGILLCHWLPKKQALLE